MAYNMRDLNNAANSISQSLEARSQEKGQQLADSLIEGTRHGRGFWLLIVWPAGLLICVFLGSFFVSILESFGIPSPFQWGGMLGGFFIARSWYRASFTLNHPLISSVFGYFTTALTVIYLANWINL